MADIWNIVYLLLRLTKHFVLMHLLVSKHLGAVEVTLLLLFEL